MILSGEKKEEYRDMTPYWDMMFSKIPGHADTITFSNGYAKDRRQFVIEWHNLSCGYGKEIWGYKLPKLVYVLSLGKIIKKINC